MTNGPEGTALLRGRGLRKSFERETGERVVALEQVSFEIARGTLTALVGPDGAGKTTLLRLATGLLTPDAGELQVLGRDVARDPQYVQDRVGYMPQRFGLYEDLSVQENLDLYADLHGVSAGQRRSRYPQLFEMTALGPFTRRLAGQLSGGMKQKLGLACALVRAPELLLLDEPTVGVDPLSRHELWQIILRLVREQHTTVLISTSYLDEAERCAYAIVLHDGKVLAQGPPDRVSRLAEGRVFLADPPARQSARAFQARLLDSAGIVDAVPHAGRVRLLCTDAADLAPLSNIRVLPVRPSFEDGFMLLLRKSAAPPASVGSRPTAWQPRDGDSTVVRVRELVRRFGNFTAVDHIGFEVRRGEIFGLLGPNGAGKTTTFRMLCGLLPASAGTLEVAGSDLRHARAEGRQRIGYVAQKLSLYGQLSVRENLEFFAAAYGLRGERQRSRIDWALDEFELRGHAHLASGELPGGYRQRLAMAAALLHQPEILFLDEPTSGADPLARRAFWRRITQLADEGVTVIVTTHFLEEAEYCDQIVILDQGHLLAQGTPAQVRALAQPQAGREPTMEDAFVSVVMRSRNGEARAA